jgi:hypothetical protein
MAALDPAVWLATLLQIELPGENVNLCDGGFVDFDTGSGVERFNSVHPVFGTIAEIDSITTSVAAQAEGSSFALIPNPEAALTDWFNDDLRDCRVRFWFGELESDLKTMSEGELLGDYFVDTFTRVISADGRQTLEISLIARDQRLFFINEGNVCSERWHKSNYPGEDGFNNCTDTPVPVAWGVATPPAGTTNGGSRVGFSDAVRGVAGAAAGLAR